MCLIIFAPSINKLRLKQKILKKGFDDNSHGAGFAYVEDGKVKISKAHFKYEDFIESFREVTDRLTKGPILIHFRWATCGSHNYINTQPICIHKDKMVMAHNGIFSGLSNHPDDISDSVYLALLIKKLGWSVPLNGAQKEMLEGLCDDYSKLVFLDNRGRYNIINEKAGKWVSGAWYSDGGDIFDESAAKVYKPKRARYNKNSHSTIIDNDYPQDDEPTVDNMGAAASFQNMSRNKLTPPGCSIINRSSIVGPYASTAPAWAHMVE